MPSIEVNGETIAYERAGNGPALVLVHSLGTGAWLWEEQIRRWQGEFDVIAFDARGHGASSNKGGVSMRAVAEDIRAALKELGISRAHFLGISMGGLICSRIHQADPELMLSLVIADSFSTLGGAGPDRVRTLEETIGPISMAEYGRIYADETILPATAREHHRRLAESIGAMDKGAYLQTVRSIFTEDVVGCMEKMRLPVLVVVGEEDQRTPPAASEKIAGLIAGAELKRIPDAAHLANLDNPDGFHAAVDPFLRAERGRPENGS